MSRSEFILEWNETFSFKINETELMRPTQCFLFNALASFLETINFDSSALINMQNHEDGNVQRLFKVKLCHYIDNIYKSSDKSHSFLYYDLIHPSPKKTAHLLIYLLNYLNYYRMVKNDTKTYAEQYIEEHSKLLATKIKLQSENEQSKIQAESIDKTIEKYSSKLPKLNDKIEKLSTKNKISTETLKTLESTLSNYDGLLISLKHTDEDLRNQVITEDEVQALKSNQHALEKDLKEQQEIENDTITRNQDCSMKINKFNEAINKIESTLQAYNFEDAFPLQKEKQKFVDLTQKLSLKKSVAEDKKVLIKTFTETCKSLENTLKEKDKNLQDFIETSELELSELSKKVENEGKVNEALTKELNNIEMEILQQNENCELILKSAEDYFGSLTTKNSGNGRV